MKEPYIHRPKNVVTLVVDVRTQFDTLRLWVEPTVSNSSCEFIHSCTESPQDEADTPHPRYLEFHYKRTVTFKTPDEGNSPFHLQNTWRYLPHVPKLLIFLELASI
jgi:hypothetical protein